jgi:hypothetical protein
MGRMKTPKQATLDATTAIIQDNVGLARSTTSRSRKLSTSERRALSRNPQTVDRGAAPAQRKGALLYGRVSSDDSAESNLSIPDQLKKLRKYCDDTDRHVRHVYVDEGISAYLQVIRPQLSR